MPFTNRMTLISTALVAALILSSAATHAQSLQSTPAPQERPIAIINATIHPVTAPTIERGYIVFDDGRITQVGQGDYPGGDGEVMIHDAAGMHVYPGMISAATTIGLLEIGAVRATDDQAETGSVTPEVRAFVAVNPDSTLIPVARANGILTMNVIPQGGVISGYSSLMRLDGWTTEEMTIDDRAALVVRWPRVRPINAWWMRMSEEEQLAQAKESLDRLEDAFRDAAAYLKARGADEEHPFDLRAEAFGPVLDGDAPTLIVANDAAQIRSAVAWAARKGMNIAILGGLEADQCIDLLKAHDVPVIIEGTHRMPSRRDSAYDEAFTLPKRLHDAGVRFCIASGEEPAHERSLPYHAAMAAAYGLDPQLALESVTTRAAEILGVGDSLGALEPGRFATLIITTGHPLEITTDTLAAYIEGARVDLGNKQKTLYHKYRTRYEQMGLLE
ncbi:MAG: amidohydrolase family protein [Phycisphaerales bacterium]